jgi:hypothetical protein
VLSIVRAEAALPASSLREQECASARARPAIAERLGSGLARERFRDGDSALAQPGGHCAPVAQSDDSSGDESRQADGSADYSLPPGADDFSPGGCLALADWALPQADDLSPDDGSADSHQGDRSAALWMDDLTATDRFLPAAELDGSPPGDCSAVTAPADSAGSRVADSAVRGWPHRDARSEQSD